MSDEAEEKFHVMELAVPIENVTKIAFDTKLLGASKFANSVFSSHKKGMLVKIHPCAEKYNDKTYVGFYLGDAQLGVGGLGFKPSEPTTITIKASTLTNPAIFVPELGEVIYGYESWWSPIKSVEELEKITDDDIADVWYVKLIAARALADLEAQKKEVTDE